MKRSKRLLAFMMSAMMVSSLVPGVSFADQEMINIKSDWSGSVFGDVSQTAITSTNFEITEGSSGDVTLRSSNNIGKISSSSEGIAYYYKKVPADANFEISAKARVQTWTANNQVSFGLMLRSNVLVNTAGGSSFTGDYVALGALDQKMESFYKPKGQNKSVFATPSSPAKDNVYDLSIKKSGTTYVLKIGEETQTIENYTGTIEYAGLFTARNTTVTYSDVNLNVAKEVRELKVDSSAMSKPSYKWREKLDLTGLKVTAVYKDNSEEAVPIEDLIVTGFDSSNNVNSTNTVTISYSGVTAPLGLTIVSVPVTGLTARYYPAKTSYYPQDTLDTQGMIITADYGNGYVIEDISSDKYTVSVGGVPAPYVFETPGTKNVTITSTETPAISASFPVEVKNASIMGLDIKQLPQKTQYYLGDKLDLDGLAVYAKYSDQAAVRLLKNEYTASALDSATAGQKQITITHKGKTSTFTVNVKQKELTGIAVTEYPQTTYKVGEVLDLTDMQVSKVYDNADKDTLAAADYSVDASGFDKTKAGTYDLRIIPSDTSLRAITLQVTVRDDVPYVWKAIRFGQSSSDAGNKTTINADGSIKLEALSGAGKITGDHDGIAFYYTEIDATRDNFELSADIKVTEFGKETYDGQEGFGIMARDAIGTPGDSAVFASNIAAVGGYSGGTTKPIGTQFYIRTGVEAPNGTGSKGIQNVMLSNERPAPANTYPNKAYKLTLAKTNSGYTGKLNNGSEQIFYEPDMLQVQDSSKIYVGFFAARVATIEVSNIQLNVTAAQTDAHKVEAPKQAATPNFSITGLSKTSSTAYTLGIKPTVDGTVTVKQGQRIIAQDQAVLAGKVWSLNTTVSANTYTNFSATFLPDDTLYLTSYDKLVKNFTVENKSYAANGNIYVSPTGTSSGDGSRDNPLDLDTAVDFVKAGQQIILLDGKYVRSAKLEIKKGNDGTADAMKYLIADNGAKPVIDFNKKSEGVVLSGSYWHVKGIDFARSASNLKGFTVGGNHNIIELCRFYENGDTGLQISRTDDSDNIADWPSYNLILNSESFDNRDPSDNNADGFAAKLTVGVGNVFRGDISHNNIDDGWDLYTKSGSGAIGPVTLENCIAYDNGTLTNGTVGAGDKNGFKLGGEGIHVPHIIRNSIAFNNGAFGYTSNSNPGLQVENSIGFNNAKGNLNLTTYTGIKEDFKLNGFISYQVDHKAADNYNKTLAAENNYLFDGSAAINKSGKRLVDASFASLAPVIPYERNTDGNIIWGDFLKFNASETTPGIPTGLTAIGAHEQAVLNWDTVLGATYYSIYRSTAETGVYVPVAANVTRATYTNTTLTNGTAYYFKITAANERGVSGYSSPVSVTPIPAPAAPAKLTLTAGSRTVQLQWSTVTGATYYNIYRGTAAAKLDLLKSNVTAAAYTDTEVANNTTYYYSVTAASSAGEGIKSTVASAMPYRESSDHDSGKSSGGGGGSTTAPNTPTTTPKEPEASNNVSLTVNVVKETINGQTVAKVSLDDAALQKALDTLQKSTSASRTLSVEIKSQESAAKVQLSAAAVADAQKKVPEVRLAVTFDQAAYNLPVKALDLAATAQALGSELKDVKITIAIEKVTGAAAGAIEASAKQNGLKLLSGAIDFLVTAEANGKTVTIHDFGKTYVARTLSLAAAVDSAKATVAVYDPASGSFSFVPAVFKTAAGKTEVAIKRPGNSIYAVVESVKSFADMTGHWAKGDVELLASKLVVNGTSDGAFAPQAPITRAEFAALLVRSLGLNGSDTAAFRDVNASDWFASSVGAATKIGLADGFEDGTFRPNDTITREQMASLIHRAIKLTGKTVSTDANKLAAFEDSSTISAWAKDAVAAAVNAGAVNGATDTTFVPKGQATRAEAAVMLKRLLQLAELMN